ncbi:MAG: hypothetical protein OXC68_00390 [Aestuariivita sp.]|nr:hypothetical protein [Aestuariivita sp.]
MSKFRRSELQNFVDDGAKESPPVFVGRKDIFREISVKIRRTGERKVGIPGNTTVIQGAPGAGKSSILSYLEAQNTDYRAPKTFSVSSIELDQRFPDVLMAIGALGSTRKSKLKTLAVKTAKTVSGLALLDIIGQISMSLQDLKGLFKSCEIENVMSLHDAFPAEEWDTPVIVAVDEIQNLPEGKESKQAKFLQALHEATTKLPLALVVAGLGDTHSVIRSMGLTHGILPHSLGCFTADDISDLTHRWCDHFGIAIGSCRGEIDVLIAKTDGWPRHVHWAQQALAEALLVEGVDGLADRITDWALVYERSHQLRQGYYKTQFSAAMVSSRKLVGRVMLEVAKAGHDGAFFKHDQIVGLVEKFAEEGDEPGWRIPKPHDSFSYVTHLVHCGVLQQDTDTFSMTCPIPSFQRYIVEMGGFEVPLELELKSGS